MLYKYDVRDLDVVYPFELFMGHWQKFGKFGLAITTFAIRFTLSEEYVALLLASKEEFAKSIIIGDMVNKEQHDIKIIYNLKRFVGSGWV